MKKWLTGILLLVCTSNISAQDREISFFNIFDGRFTTTSMNSLDWMQDGQFYTRTVRLSNGVEIRKFDIISGSFEVIVSTEQLQSHYPEAGQIQDYQFSKNEEFMLLITDIEPLSKKDELIQFETDIEPLWRSYKANHFVYDRRRDSFLKLGASGEKQQSAELSPKGNNAAFVQDNNLFWKDLENGEIRKITDDGEPGKIINGTSDWVYGEEFGLTKGWFWSPDGSKIAYYKFDESGVKDFTLTEWNGIYPGEIQFKYPKAGEQNSEVHIGIYSINTGETEWVELPEDIEYIPRIYWTRDPSRLAVKTMNRLQNHLQLYLVDAKTGSSESLWELKDDAWIDINDNITFISDAHSFLFTSDKHGFNHFYLKDMKQRETKQITSGEWEVTDFVGYDETNEWLYYISTEDSPLERHIYRVKIDGSDKEKLSRESGWNQADMSPDFQFFVHYHSTIDKPPSYTLRKADGEEIRVIEANESAKRILENFRLPEISFKTIQLEEAEKLNVMMIKPPDFDPGKKYPLIFYVYGGPGSQTVVNRYRLGHKDLWHYYLATNGYIVVSVDNRGTGGRGREFKKRLYRKLGQYETADQVEAARYFSKMEFVDAERIGIWGWSYGGYISTLALAKGNEIFSLGIAVAPVTNWKYYNTIFTERYLQTPEMNLDGYETGAPVYQADKIEGKYLLIHGTADEYVHFQNAVDMVDALVRNNVQFQTMFYPNRNHSIHGGNTRLHLFRLMTDFVKDNL